MIAARPEDSLSRHQLVSEIRELSHAHDIALAKIEGLSQLLAESDERCLDLLTQLVACRAA